MHVKVRRLGCSVIITLPKSLLAEIDIKAGDYLDLCVTDANTRRDVVQCSACDGDGRAKIGWRVECAVCHLTKAPRGRSVPLEMANSLCNIDCPGYREAPEPGSLWLHEEAHSGMTGPVCGNCGGSGIIVFKKVRVFTADKENRWEAKSEKR